MTSPFTCVLLDLDGTITDSAPGITSSLAWMFGQLGLPVPPPAELLTYVGPPILDAFRDQAGFDPAESQHALSIYRGHYLEFGAFDSSVYPGMEAALQTVHAAGLPISLATSKPETSARIILEHFDLARYIDVLTGASDDEVRSAKEDVVAEALVRLESRGVDLSRPIMVGDREHDVHGAAANGVPTIFVEWGYGSTAEQAGAIAVAHTPEHLTRLLLDGPPESASPPAPAGTPEKGAQ